MAAHARSEDSKAFKKVTFEFGSFKLRYAWVSQRGYYPEDLDKANQDAHREVENFGKASGIMDTAFFGVFDGHGKTGNYCAEFTRDHMPELLEQHLVKEAKAAQALMKTADAPIAEDAEEKPAPTVIKPTTLLIEKAYKGAFEEVNSMLHARDDIDDSMSGTTAITAVISRGTLFVANVGDSRAIVGQDKGGKLIAYPLSSDQTPFRKDERDRCKAAGAVVANMDQMDGLEPMHEDWQEQAEGDDDDDSGDPPRVWLKTKMVPGCAFTRSIGDAIGEQVGVYATPEVVAHTLTDADKYCLIASDGVWEFLTNQTVLNMVAAYKSPLKACKAVVNEAYKLWLQYDVRTDDITMTAIYLEDMGGLAQAHDDEVKRLQVEAEALAPNENGAALRRQSVREIRRKSCAIQNVKVKAPGSELNKVPETVTEGDARPVRRVMTKEKRKIILAPSTQISDGDEKGFSYTVVGKSGEDTGEQQSEHELIKMAISTNFLLSHLNIEQQKAVFASMDVCKCEPGNIIIEKGQVGEWFYVVHSGSYEAWIGSEKIHTYHMESMAENNRHGVSFGELALLYPNQPRSATIKCIEDGKLWRLHAKAFKDIVMRSSTQKILKTLRSVEALKELTLSQLQRLYDALSELRVSKDQNVIVEGEPGNDFYVIMDGSAKVYKKESDKPDAKEMELMSLGKFDYFGERALFNDAPRAATVRAVEEMKLLQIGRETFEQVLGSLEDIIKYNCRKREEAAHQTYLQRQAEGMLHASPQEFEPVARLAANEVSDLYVVKRKPKIDEDAPASATGTERLLVRVVSKKKTTEENLRSRVMSEIKLVGDMLPSAFIPSLLATFSDKHRMYAVMGCILSMELTRAVGHSALLDVADGEKTAKFFVTALMCAIIHLHKQEIACRDVSMESIMLDSKGYPQLVDFTLGKKMPSYKDAMLNKKENTDSGDDSSSANFFLQSLCGTPEYNAPEQVRKSGHGLPVDWWALGILTFELLYAKTPFEQDAAPVKPPPAQDRRMSQRRGSADGGRVLLPPGAAAAEATPLDVHTRILAYAGAVEPKIKYPEKNIDNAPYKNSLSNGARDWIEDLLDPDPETRLGSPSRNRLVSEEGHEFIEGINLAALEDGSLKSPCYDACVKESNSFFTEPSTSVAFEAEHYVGDSRWCDDWDYTCTVGSQVENTEIGTGPGLASQRRASHTGAKSGTTAK